MYYLRWRRLKAHLPVFGSVKAARAVVESARRLRIFIIIVDDVAGYSSSSYAIFGDVLQTRGLARKLGRY
jgi:hypothetical protein